MRIPIPQLLIRLRTEAQRNPGEAVAHRLKGQGASYSLGEQLVWKFWTGAYAHPSLHRIFRWLATRLRAFAPKQQMGWTRFRTPLQPAERSLHDLMAERKGNRL